MFSIKRMQEVRGEGSVANKTMIQGHICQLCLCTVSDESVEHLLTCVESLSNIQGRDHSDSVMCCYHQQTTWVLLVLHMPASFQTTVFPKAGTSSCAGRCSWGDQPMTWEAPGAGKLLRCYGISSGFFH